MAVPRNAKPMRRASGARKEIVPDVGNPSSVTGPIAPLSVVPSAPLTDPEVSERATRRRFTAAYKLQVLRQAEACASPGDLGALLRREGLYSSHLTTWRRQREAGSLAGLSPKPRGRPAASSSPLTRRVAELERDNARLTQRLQQAEAIIAVQKKLSEALGIALTPSETGTPA
jgi:transposase-like protein